MAEQAQGQEKVSSGAKIVFILLAGALSMFFAEVVTMVGATILAFNSKLNVIAAVITAVGSFAIIGILYWIASKRYGKQFSIESLKPGKAGMSILILYLAALYILSFFYLLPERIAPPLTIILTLGVYVVIASLLYLKKPDDLMPSSTPGGVAIFGVRELAILAAVFTILAALICLMPTLGYPLTLVFYITLFLLSPILLIWAVVNVIRSRLKTKAAGA